MSTELSRSPDAEPAPHGDLFPSPAPAGAGPAPPLSSLPVGARLVVRCRKDWRAAVVAAVAPDRVTLSVGSPTGRTYRLRRPPESPLSLDGAVPVLGDAAPSASWRAGLARYDVRW